MWHVRPRRWDHIVAAWTIDDRQALEDVWTTDVLPDLGSVEHRLRRVAPA
ncbi:hypothetical protein NHG22_34490 [Streptomyces sp. ATE26]|nr:hypothetical protein [Streptomyces sp. ATE26]MDI1458886.1 hypothetical protein [Streptomyces sp. ATE26]